MRLMNVRRSHPRRPSSRSSRCSSSTAHPLRLDQQMLLAAYL
jgi:hypothetical protein